MDDGVGKDVIVIYDTLGTVASGGEFWTDSNGRHFVRRRRNHRCA